MNFLADGVTVMLVSIEEFADFVIRHFTLEKVLKTGVEKRSLTQYQFLSWPDHGMKTMKLGLIDQVATSQPRNLWKKKKQQMVRRFHYLYHDGMMIVYVSVGVPTLPIGMASFVTLVRRQQINEPNPILVHCSAGSQRYRFLIALGKLSDLFVKN